MSEDPEITDPRDPYRRPDIVTELDRYLVRDETVGFTEMVQRARDEIVALREKHVEVVEFDLVRHARDAALEEAARVADGYCTDRTDDVARGIRALKGEAHD